MFINAIKLIFFSTLARLVIFTFISYTEIFKACRELSINKSGGPDFVLNEFFKYGINEMVFYLCNLFNTIFEKGYFPTKWTEGFIVPLHKKGDINQVENYRGITLLSSPCANYFLAS